MNIIQKVTEKFFILGTLSRCRRRHVDEFSIQPGFVYRTVEKNNKQEIKREILHWVQ